MLLLIWILYNPPQHILSLSSLAATRLSLSFNVQWILSLLAGKFLIANPLQQFIYSNDSKCWLVPFIQIRQVSHRQYHFQQFLRHYATIHYQSNMFNMPVPRNDCILVCYSSFHFLHHNIFCSLLTTMFI